jgi:tetratricopeptide (TPR) repeat protein
LGRADEALAGLPDPANIFTAGGVFAGQRALCLAHLGRTPEAADILQRMLVARDMGRSDDPTSAAVQRYLLDAAVLLKDAEAARVLAARMAALAGLLHTEADMCYNIGRLLGGAAALLGETEKARGYYVQALEVCEKVRFRPELALTRLELAELLLANYPDERAAAIEHLDLAIAEFREMKMQPSLERALRHKDVLKA